MANIPILQCAERQIDLSKPHVMGIINTTPDSFSDGGKFNHQQQQTQLEYIEKLAIRWLEAGATFLDVGGESTRPGAQAVGEQEEMDRVLPVIERLSKLDAVVSVDTSKASVMREAIAMGASMINDVYALRLEGSLDVAAQSNVAVCLMHMQGKPRTMQDAPQYDDVIADVKTFLEQRVQACVDQGIAKNRMSIDPGFGFGKSFEHNCALMQQLPQFEAMGLPVLAGISRKSVLGQITGKTVDERMTASVSAAIIAAQRGAKIIRVHDVLETLDALKVLEAFSVS